MKLTRALWRTRTPEATEPQPSRLSRAGLRRSIAVTGSFALLTFGAVAASSAPAFAASATSVAMSVSNNATNATGVTYTWNFTTATAAQLTSLTLTVPAGTTMTGAALTTPGTAYGLGPCTIATPTLASNVVTVPLTCSATITAAMPISIAVGGFTNTGTAATAFLTQVTTNGSSGVVDTGSATGLGVDFTSNITNVTVVVPQSLTFLNNNTAITLLPIPGSAMAATASPVKLTVKTNAVSGYTLNACVTSANAIKSGSNAIGQLASLGALTGTAFGAQASITGTGATLYGAWANANGANYLGYDAVCTAGTNSIVAGNIGPTAGDELTLVNAATVSATQAAGTYVGKITYQAVPTF